MGRKGFTLVELSVVLVLLGLITGGILAGRNLIHASELKTIMAEERHYVTASVTFFQQYGTFPGDLSTATKYWGTNPNGCPDYSRSQVTRKETCDGNNDGLVSGHGVAGVNNGVSNEQHTEQYTYWQHLANAGLIEGTYTGNNQTTNADFRQKGQVAGINVPKSKIADTGWAVYSIFFSSWGNYQYNINNQFHGLSWGKSPSSPPNNHEYLDKDAITPEDAWSIDKKYDDGMPGTGNVTTSQYAICTTGTANATDYTGTYNIANTNKDCGLIFPNPF